MAHGGLFEPSEILRQMPGDAVSLPDYSILGHCGNRFE
jgi:hypothetical protein